MADNIKGLRFFMEGRVNEWLAYETDKEKIDGFLIEDGDHFIIDIIEQPFHCEASAKDGDAKLELYVRNEFGAYMEPDLSIVIHSGKAKPEFTRSGKISGDGMKQLLLFMRAASVLKRYSDRFGFAKLYPDYDPDREGIIVRRESDEPTFQRVRGKNRPPLAVRNMVGNVELARPYENELVSVLGMELSAFEARLEEAEDGDTEAMRDIAEKYVTGYEPEEIAPDAKKAWFWMNRLAEEGDADALYRVGLFKSRGFGTSRSFEEAADYMRKAARAGHPKAEKAAVQYESMAADEAKANNNDPQAMAQLAASYMLLAGSRDKDNAAQDYEESRRWATESAKAGNGFGCWVLGLLYEHGRGVEKDLEKAAALYEHGADLGCREAQNNFGTFLMQGTGVPQDKRRAFALFQAAAEQGYGVAMRNLGNCYQYAYGTDGNMKKAMEWYERALDVLDDPELAQKVQLFREMKEVDPEWGMDYPERVDDLPKEEKLDSPLKEALRAQGRPYNDEAINSLSVKEVFELLGSVEHEYEQYAPVSETGEPFPAEIPVQPQVILPAGPAVPELPVEPDVPEPEYYEPKPAVKPVPEEAPLIREAEETVLPESAEDEVPAPETVEAPVPEEIEPAVSEVPEFPQEEELPAEPEPVAEEPEPEVPAEEPEENKKPDLRDLFPEPVEETAFPDSLELTRAMNDFGVLEPEGEQPAEAGSDLFEEEEPEEETEFRERIYESDVMARPIRNSKYRLSYAEGNTCGNEHYSISIPDGFRVKPNAEGRDFIAWQLGENNPDYNSARITFYAGVEAGKNGIDTRLLTPEICALLTESNYWQADALRLLAEKNRLIVLNEEHPAGSVIAGYNDGNFMYNISIVMPGYIKTMRAQVLGAEDEDIPSCDRMVLEWVRTMTAADAFEEPKELDEPYFTNQPLTDRLAAEWKEACDIRYTILERGCRDNIELARQRYAKGAYGVDGEAAFRADLQGYLNTWARRYSAFLDSGISAIEQIKRNNPGNDLVRRLIETFRPAVISTGERTETVTAAGDTVSASVSELKELRERLAEFDRKPAQKQEVIPPYRERTYHENHVFTLGGLSGLLPDGMITFDHAPENDANDPEFLKKLHGIYSLAAIPADFAGGFNRYTEGAFCVNIGSPVRNSGFGVLFETGTEAEISEQLVQFLTANLKRNNKYNEHYPVEYVGGGKDYGIAAAQTSGNKDKDTVGSSFIILVLDRDDLYQGNIYFRSEGTDEQFREAAYNWLETIVRSEKETAQPIILEKTEKNDTKPATREDIEKQFRADRLRSALQKEWKWISLHGKEIARNPEINVEDALFVFTGAAGLPDFPEILNRLEARGGIRRDTVTGRTDYLVCNPSEAGETKIAAARKMKQSGSTLKIILLNDLRRALGMEEVDVRTELEELLDTKIEPQVRLEDIEPEEEPLIQEPAEETDADEQVSDTAKNSVKNPMVSPFEIPTEVLEDRDPLFDTLGFNITKMDEEIHQFTDAPNIAEEAPAAPTEAEPKPETEDQSEAEETAETVSEDETVKSEPVSEEPDTAVTAETVPEAEEKPAEKEVSADAEEITEETEAEEEVAEAAEELPEESDDMHDTAEEAPDALVNEAEEVSEAAEETEGIEESETVSEETEPAVDSEDTVPEAEPEEEAAEPESETYTEVSEPEASDELPEKQEEGNDESEEPEETGEETSDVTPEETSKEPETFEESKANENESESGQAEIPADEVSSESETPEAEPEPDPAVETYTEEARSYLNEKREELSRFRDDWEFFSSTVARTLMLKIQNGIKPKVSEGDDGDKSVSFDSDTSEADAFVKSIPQKVEHRLEQLSDDIRSFNNKLEDYEAHGLDEMVFLNLCRMFTEFKETGRNLSLKFTSRDISYPLSEEIEALGAKWEEKYRENKEKLEAFEQKERESALAEAAPQELKMEEDTPIPVRSLPVGGKGSELLSRTEVHRQIEALLEQDDTKTEPEKKSGNIVLLIVLVIAVLACIGIAAYWYVTNYLPAHQAPAVFKTENALCAQLMNLLYYTAL